MKKLFFILLLLLSMKSFSQRTYNLDSIKPNTSTSVKTADIAIYNGQKYPIYKSKNNKLYIIVIAKTTGNPYKKYLDANIK